MSTVCFVSCSKRKLGCKTQAQYVYCSALFKKSKAYAENFDKWFILSAKYGLLMPTEIIEPYDIFLGNLDRKLWFNELVKEKLDNYVSNRDKVVILSGKLYREFLEEYLKVRGIGYDVPLVGLSLMKQISFLTPKQENIF